VHDPLSCNLASIGSLPPFDGMLHKLNYYVSLTYFNIDLSTLVTRLPYADYLQDKSNTSKKPAMELLIRYSSNCMSTTWWWQHLFKVYNAAIRHAHQHHLSTVVAVWFTSPLGVQLQLSCIVCKLNLYYSQCCCSVLTNCHFCWPLSMNLLSFCYFFWLQRQPTHQVKSADLF